MDIFINKKEGEDRKKVRETCVHCQGTGVCGQSIFKEDRIKNRWPVDDTFEVYRECSRCGKGIALSDTASASRKLWGHKNPPPPSCSVCGGNGYKYV